MEETKRLVEHGTLTYNADWHSWAQANMDNWVFVFDGLRMLYKLCECTIVCLWQPSNDSLSYYSLCYYSIRNILSVHWSSASTSSDKLCHTSIACTVTAADVSTQEMVTPSRTWLIMSTWVQVFTNVMTVHLVACQQLLRLRTVTRFSAAQSTMRCVTKSCCVD